jgi:hypothetical protein
MGEKRKMFMVWVTKTEGKSLLRRPGSRWEDGIRIDLGEVG